MKTILDRAPHVVEVQNRESQRDASGARIMVPVGEPISVRCMTEPVREWSSAEEEVTHGLQMVNLLVIRASHWPGDVHSHVYANGKVYETVGSPQHYAMSKRTTHWRVTVRYVGTDER